MTSHSYDPAKEVLTYVTPTLDQGYYVLISTFNDIKDVTVTHSTLEYTCPFDKSFTDIH